MICLVFILLAGQFAHRGHKCKTQIAGVNIEVCEHIFYSK